MATTLDPIPCEPLPEAADTGLATRKKRRIKAKQNDRTPIEQGAKRPAPLNAAAEELSLLDLFKRKGI